MIAGNNISAQSTGSTRFKKDGLYLTISPVTAANEGEYLCLAKDSEMEIIRAYHVTVDGEEDYFLSYDMLWICLLQWSIFNLSRFKMDIYDKGKA